MSTIDVTNDRFTCHREDDLAVITILEGAKSLSTTVGGKEDLMGTLKTIKEDRQIKGVAMLYSDKYLGDVEFKMFLQEILDAKHYKGHNRIVDTYKNAIVQFIQMANTYPKPVVVGMKGKIDPDDFAINLALDLRIATDNACIIHPNLQLGFPPSPPLSFYLVHSLGSHKATELIMTRQKITAQDALDLGLITQIVSGEDLKKTCLDKLRQLSSIPGHTLVESRRMLQPDIGKIKKYLDAAFDGAVRCLNKMNT